MEEEILIAKCILNNAKAQKALYEKYYRKMYYVALRYLNNAEDAEDALVEAFIRVINNLGNFRYDGNGSLQKWIKTITINESLRALSKRKVLNFHDNLLDINHETTEDIEGDIDMEYLLSLVRSLPDGYRIVFNLYVIENHSHNEIAEMLNISVSTSKSQLYKARQSLMIKIKKQEKYELGRN